MNDISASTFCIIEKHRSLLLPEKNNNLNHKISDGKLN